MSKKPSRHKHATGKQLVIQRKREVRSSDPDELKPEPIGIDTTITVGSVAQLAAVFVKGIDDDEGEHWQRELAIREAIEFLAHSADTLGGGMLIACECRKP